MGVLLFIIAVLLVMLAFSVLMLMHSRQMLHNAWELRSSLQSDVNDARATISELETERDILRASVELERTRADANYEAGKTAKKDLEAALFKLRMVRRAMDHDGNPVIVQSEA